MGWRDGSAGKIIVTLAKDLMFTAPCNSCSRGSDFLSWPLQVLHPIIQANAHKHKIKLNIF